VIDWSIVTTFLIGFPRWAAVVDSIEIPEAWAAVTVKATTVERIIILPA
jgi:hypothetical protein